MSARPFVWPPNRIFFKGLFAFVVSYSSVAVPFWAFGQATHVKHKTVENPAWTEVERREEHEAARLEVLTRDLSSRSARTRIMAAKSLGDAALIGMHVYHNDNIFPSRRDTAAGSAFRALIATTRDSNHDVQLVALQSLNNIIFSHDVASNLQSNIDLLDAAEKYFDDEDANVRRLAIRLMIFGMKPRHGLALLLELYDDDENSQVAAAEALGQFDPQARQLGWALGVLKLSGLETLGWSPDIVLRESPSRLFVTGYLISALISVVRDENATLKLREKAVESLGQLLNGATQVSEYLQKADTGSVGRLIDQLNPDLSSIRDGIGALVAVWVVPELRRSICRAADDAGYAKLYPLVLDGMDDPAPDVRSACIEVAADLNIDGSLPKLREHISDPNKDAKVATLNAIGKLGIPPDGLTKPIAAQLQNPDLEIRTAAANALASFGPASADCLLELESTLHDPEHDVRIAAIEAISNIGPKASPAVPGLLHLAQEDRATGTQVVAALQALHAENALESLQSNPELRSDVTKALAYLNDERMFHRVQSEIIGTDEEHLIVISVASWCPHSRRLIAAIKDPEIQALLRRNTLVFALHDETAELKAKLKTMVLQHELSESQMLDTIKAVEGSPTKLFDPQILSQLAGQHRFISPEQLNCSPYPSFLVGVRDGQPAWGTLFEWSDSPLVQGVIGNKDEIAAKLHELGGIEPGLISESPVDRCASQSKSIVH